MNCTDKEKGIFLAVCKVHYEIEHLREVEAVNCGDDNSRTSMRLRSDAWHIRILMRRR